MQEVEMTGGEGGNGAVQCSGRKGKKLKINRNWGPVSSPALYKTFREKEQHQTSVACLHHEIFSMWPETWICCNLNDRSLVNEILIWYTDCVTVVSYSVIWHLQNCHLCSSMWQTDMSRVHPVYHLYFNLKLHLLLCQMQVKVWWS